MSRKNNIQIRFVVQVSIKCPKCGKKLVQYFEQLPTPGRYSIACYGCGEWVEFRMWDWVYGKWQSFWGEIFKEIK